MLRILQRVNKDGYCGHTGNVCKFQKIREHVGTLSMLRLSQNTETVCICYVFSSPFFPSDFTIRELYFSRFLFTVCEIKKFFKVIHHLLCNKHVGLKNVRTIIPVMNATLFIKTRRKIVI